MALATLEPAVADIESAVEDLPLDELLGLLSEREDSVVISITSPTGSALIHMDSGYVEWVESTLPKKLLLGDVLCQMGLTTPEVVLQAFVEQMADTPTVPFRLGSYLMRSHGLAEADVATALTVQTAENLLQLLLLKEGSYQVEVARPRRIPFYAHLDVTALVKEMYARGPAFEEFDPQAKILIEESLLPAPLRPLLKSTATLREFANQSRKPEWALAQALRERAGGLKWSVPQNSSIGLSFASFTELLTQLRPDLEKERARADMSLLRCRYLVTAISAVEQFYKSSGFFQLADPNVITTALEGVLSDSRIQGRYPVERLLRIHPEGGIDLTLASGLLSLLLDQSRRAEMESRLELALTAVFDYVTRMCIRQITSDLERQLAKEALEGFLTWLRTR